MPHGAGAHALQPLSRGRRRGRRARVRCRASPRGRPAPPCPVGARAGARALGLGGAAVHRMVTLECALHGVLGGVLGLALGLPYAWLVVRAAEVSAPFTVPAGQLATVLAALVLVTAAAGTIPALRASRTPPTVAVARGD
ncbi:FtsX-like permease family protein [Streptomyces lusitanus]|uniref:FtsX-like permease family protein n=1 Tax=Streptomyces lusitanus TaxID=68232 RepID=UPI0021BFBFDB|nr:FtsX-like permease family protein [Streptomyces lusitanus]